LKVVIDTNVIVSALLNANGTPAKIVSLILNGKIKIQYDNRIIFEYNEVLSRKEFAFDLETVNDLMNYFKHDGEFVNANHLNLAFIDDADKKFYEVYKSAGAQYLTSGNLKHFPKEKNIILPKDFLEVYEG